MPHLSQLLKRVITAAVLVAVLLILFFALPVQAATLALGAFLLAAAWEWAGFAGFSRVRQRFAYVAVFALLAVLIAVATPVYLPPRPVLAASLLWWVVAAGLVMRYPLVVPPAVTAVCGACVLLPAWLGLLLLMRDPRAGPGVVLYLFGIVWAADVGAYFVGRRIGRVRLAPRVSPGKTWEGALGGLAAALLVTAAGGVWLGLPLAVMLPAGLAIALMSILGDLTVSLFKRNAGLKDSGHLFPGHGGVLDRIDGVTAAVPLFALFGGWLQLLSL
ncbi:MAG: phosphatidate cytidylyltransferase [Gammaproteobacteria bacterium]|nr:MAG: phosphatidate cytidylyltransferase [Gammaproteobacteria bacterium]